jgi:hypothetical protein
MELTPPEHSEDSYLGEDSYQGAPSGASRKVPTVQSKNYLAAFLLLRSWSAIVTTRNMSSQGAGLPVQISN